jgi:hypothetical protein
MCMGACVRVYVEEGCMDTIRYESLFTNYVFLFCVPYSLLPRARTTDI